jgi:hypothetical protein
MPAAIADPYRTLGLDLPDWLKSILNDVSLSPMMTGIETAGADAMMTPARAALGHVLRNATPPEAPNGDVLGEVANPSDLALRGITGGFALRDGLNAAPSNLSMPTLPQAPALPTATPYQSPLQQALRK